jgi:hypothetical protein
MRFRASNEEKNFTASKVDLSGLKRREVFEYSDPMDVDETIDALNAMDI